MPIYEYRCPECAARFEAIVPAAAADEAPCRTCGAPGAQRLLSVFSAPRSGGGDGAAMPAAGGGCCGGACGC